MAFAVSVTMTASSRIWRPLRRLNEGTFFGDWRSNDLHTRRSAAHQSQGQGQEGRAARLQRKRCQRKVLWRASEALVLYDRRGGTRVWRRREGLWTER